MKNKRIKIELVFFDLFLFLGILLSVSTLWAVKMFGKTSVDSMIFTLLAPTAGTDSSVIYSWLSWCLATSVLATILITLVVIYIYKRKHYSWLHYIWVVGIVVLVGSLVNVECQYHIVAYIQNQKETTYIYEQKPKKKKNVAKDGDEKLIYANPQSVEISGNETNNLIYIYLESYENTFMDKNNGGVKDVNCLPELTQLANENLNFSNTDKLGGAIAFTGSTWTIGSMVAQSSGLPLKAELANNMDKFTKFMPGAKMIGDVLKEQGYNQELLIGSKSSFAGTNHMFNQHGQYQIVDLDTIKSNYDLKDDDYCSWGINDHKLLEVARNELGMLAAKGQKFNFTMATIDCHMPSGMLCKQCPCTYKNRYENIYACQSKQVNDFITWCKQQSWYENTTIILVGDHQTMAQDYVNDVDSTYQRTTYNCFINSKIQAVNNKNRQFTQMDMYPTTLAAMGFEVKGNKLGLGTNLFSKLPTVIEKYSTSYIEQEISKSSEYLNKEIYQFE